MTTPITKEWLQQTIAEYEASRDEIPFGLETNSAMELEAFKIALAAMDAEPVAWVCAHGDEIEYNGHNQFSGGRQGLPLYAAPPAAIVNAEPVGEVSEQPDGLVMDGTVHLGGSRTHRVVKGLNKMKRLPLGTKFYTAPPAPVSIPGELTREEYKRRFMEEHDFDDTYRGGWEACRAAMLQAGNSRGTPDEQSFWDWLRDEMPTTYRWARELEDTPENSALITKGKASALDMLSAWKGCSTAMLQGKAEPVSQPYKLPPNSFTDAELEMMSHGDNPQANAYRELLAFRRKLPELIEGMDVSIDVSTCDADAGNRYFGTITELSELDGSKNGYTLLVQDAKPNFDVNGNSPVIPDGSANMLRRWLAFGRAMQSSGSQLPRHLIAETESMLTAPQQEVK